MEHQIWVWVWFFLGMFSYMAKRAYYLVTGPNPVANSYGQFLQRCWIPLAIRGGIESIFFWLCFTPTILASGLNYLGWSSFASVVVMATQVAPVAFLLGHTIDSVADFAVSKLPFVKDFLPQMPGPLVSPKE